MKQTLFIILTIIISTSINGQDLNGKWLLKEAGFGDLKKNPGLQILYIYDNSAKLFTDLELSEKQLEFKISENALTYGENQKYADFELIRKDYLRLFMNGNVNDKPEIIELDFVRLIPTKTDLTIKEIEELTYEYQEDGKNKSKLEFNKEMMDLETVKQLGKKEGQKMKIEQLDSTLFLSIYVFDRHSISLPISEVNRDFIKIYCIPTKTDGITATRAE